MIRPLIASVFALSCLVACATDEELAAPTASLDQALAAPITVRYVSETAETIRVSAYVSAAPRGLALNLTLPLVGAASMPPAVAERLRRDHELEVTIVDAMAGWSVRAPDNQLETLATATLAERIATATEFSTLCGDDIAQATVQLTDGDAEFVARVRAQHPLRPYGLHATTGCLEEGVWFGPNKCTPTLDSGCTAVVDCGTVLGGTRVCRGACLLQGYWNEVCMCNIDEVACCEAIVPPRGPIATEEVTQFEN